MRNAAFVGVGAVRGPYGRRPMTDGVSARRSPATRVMPGVAHRFTLVDWALLAAMLSVAVFRLHEVLPAAVQKLRPGFLTGPVCFALLLMRAPAHVRQQLLRQKQLRLVLLYIGWAILSVPFALYRSQSLDFAMSMYPLAMLTASILLVPRTPHALTVLTRTFAMLGGCLALIALVAGNADAETGRLHVGATLDPNDLAAVMVMSVALALGMTRRSGFLWRGIGIVISLICVLVLAKTGSRGGFVALGVTATCFAAALPGARRLLWGVLLVAAAAVSWQLLPETTRARLTTLTELENDYNTFEYGGRQEIWKRGLGYAIRNPILGVGVGNFSVAEGKNLEALGFKGKWSAAHNAYVQAAAELGLVGGGIFIFLCFTAIRSSLSWSSFGKRHMSESIARPELLAAIAGLVVAAFFLSMAYFWAFFALAALLAVANDAARAGTRPELAPQRRVRTLRHVPVT